MGHGLAGMASNHQKLEEQRSGLANTLILDFWFPECGTMHFYCFNLPYLWQFAVAALEANIDTQAR